MTPTPTTTTLGPKGAKLPLASGFRTPPKNLDWQGREVWKRRGVKGWVADAWSCYEGTFALSMLDESEKVLLHILLFAILFLLYLGVSRYLPGHVYVMTSRAKYYIYGSVDEVTWK